MAQTCDKCGVVVYRRILRLEPPYKGQWHGVDCGCMKRPRELADSTVNPYDITLDHVHDSFGKKVHVSNLRELSAAEKTYGFQSVVLNSDAQNFDNPPQQRSVTMSDIVKRKFSQVRERYA